MESRGAGAKALVKSANIESVRKMGVRVVRRKSRIHDNFDKTISCQLICP